MNATTNDVHKVHKCRFYVWLDIATGEWVLTEKKKTIPADVQCVTVRRTWTTFKQPLNSQGEKDVVEQTIVGTLAAEYVSANLPTARIVDVEPGTIRTRWTF